MDHKLAIIDLRAGGAGADTAIKPLMLQPMLFCPVVRWVCQELLACGIERFFVVCQVYASYPSGTCMISPA